MDCVHSLAVMGVCIRSTTALEVLCGSSIVPSKSLRQCISATALTADATQVSSPTWLSLAASLPPEDSISLGPRISVAAQPITNPDLWIEPHASSKSSLQWCARNTQESFRKAECPSPLLVAGKQN